MRTPFLRLFRESPFLKLLEHAEKIQESGDTFRKAVTCYLEGEYDNFEKLHLDITRIESEADIMKRNIRGHLPRGLLMPVDKFLFVSYLRTQDNVMDSVQDTLHWLSYRTTTIPEPLVDDLLLLVDKAVDVIGLVPGMVKGAIEYFRSFSAQDREHLKESIYALRQMENESDQVERKLKSDVFIHTEGDPVGTFHLIRLVEFMGGIANHAENAGDLMRAMIAR